MSKREKISPPRNYLQPARAGQVAMDLSSVLGIGVGVLLLAALFAWALLSPSPPRDSTAQAMLHMERWLAVFKIASGMTVLSVVMPTRDRLWRWLFFWGFMAALALMFAWKSRP